MRIVKIIYLVIGVTLGTTSIILLMKNCLDTDRKFTKDYVIFVVENCLSGMPFVKNYKIKFDFKLAREEIKSITIILFINESEEVISAMLNEGISVKEFKERIIRFRGYNYKVNIETKYIGECDYELQS